MKTQFNGERLKKARIYRGLTVAELAEQVGCQRQTLSMYEISKSQPTDKGLVDRLSRALSFPVNSFLQIILHLIQKVQFIFVHFLPPTRNIVANKL